MKLIKPYKILQIMTGLFLYALGITLTVQANMGVSPWTVFHQGLASHYNMTIGKAIIFTGLIILVINLMIGENIGLGTILNMIFIGLFVDLIFWLNVIPLCEHYLSGTVMMVIGMMTIAVASCLYMGAGYGSGPRDGLMIALTKITGWRPGPIRLIIESTVLIIGVFLGGQIGIGSALMAFGMGPILQLTLYIIHFDISGIEHRYLLSKKGARIFGFSPIRKE